MSDNVTMNASEHSLAQKRLAHDLKIIVLVQVVALCAFAVGLFFFGSNRIPNSPEWDHIHSLCGVLGVSGTIVFIVTAFWGFGKTINDVFLPFPVRIYGIGGFLFFFLIFSIPRFVPPACSLILFVAFPFYCVVPQFFIARWLTKEAENGTTKSVDNNLE